MKRSYYSIAIERYFSTPVPYFMLGTVPLMLYGYYQSDLCFWMGLALTVVVVAINHFLMYSLTSTFGLYATRKQVDYVSHFITGGSGTSIINWKRSRGGGMPKQLIGWASIIVSWERRMTITG